MSANSAGALLVVDVQNDFCEGGALAVPNAASVVSALNRHLQDANAKGWHVYASRDWHPSATRHFQQFGGRWPPHCIQNTHGAEFHPDLRLPAGTLVISKGQEPEDEGYSAFDGTTASGERLVDRLRADDVRHLYVGGLATDYCVKRSVLDARRFGFRVTLLGDAIAGIDAWPGDCVRAVAEMLDAGAEIGERVPRVA